MERGDIVKFNKKIDWKIKEGSQWRVSLAAKKYNAIMFTKIGAKGQLLKPESEINRIVLNGNEMDRYLQSGEAEMNGVFQG